MFEFYSCQKFQYYFFYYTFNIYKPMKIKSPTVLFTFDNYSELIKLIWKFNYNLNLKIRIIYFLNQNIIIRYFIKWKVV